MNQPSRICPVVWESLRAKSAAGHQAYIVYPVIEGIEAGTKRRWTSFARLSKTSLPN